MNKLSLASTIFALAFTTGLIGQIPEKAEDISPLLVGEIFPDVEIIDIDGATLSFHKIIDEKPTVLIFYRGGWCPYCNTHLSEVGKKEAEILALGYQVVAISPDQEEKLEDTALKDEIKYRLFSDGTGDLTRAAGIAFKAPERYSQRLLDWSGGKNKGFLPVPSVFVLDTKGEILFEYISPNYKQRISGALLLAVLKVLKEEME